MTIYMNSQPIDEFPPPPFKCPKLRRSIREDIWMSAIDYVSKKGFQGVPRMIVKAKNSWGNRSTTIYYLKDDTILGFPAYVLNQDQVDCIKESGFLVVEDTDPISGYTYYIVYRDTENGAVPVIRMRRQIEDVEEMAVEKISQWYKRMKQRPFILSV